LGALREANRMLVLTGLATVASQLFSPILFHKSMMTELRPWASRT
jgi:hypothetical protein